MKSSSHLLVLLGVAALLGSVKPVAANGGNHFHLGGIFFLLLGGLVFVSGIGAILYLLLRPESDEADDVEDENDDEDLY